MWGPTNLDNSRVLISPRHFLLRLRNPLLSGSHSVLIIQQNSEQRTFWNPQITFLVTPGHHSSHKPKNTSRTPPPPPHRPPTSPGGCVPLTGSSVDVFKFYLLEKSLMLHDKDISLWLPPRDPSWIFWGHSKYDMTWLYWNKFKVFIMFMRWKIKTELQHLYNLWWWFFNESVVVSPLYFVLFCSVCPLKMPIKILFWWMKYMEYKVLGRCC